LKKNPGAGKIQIVINENSLLQKKENLFVLPLPDGAIFLDPDSGNFLKIAQELIPILLGLNSPLSFAQVQSRHPQNVDELAAFLTRLYHKGLLKINGRYYFHQLSLWDKKPEDLLFIMEFPPLAKGSELSAQLEKIVFHLEQEKTCRSISLLIVGREPFDDLVFLKILAGKFTERLAEFRLIIATGKTAFYPEELDFIKQSKARLLVNLDLASDLTQLKEENLTFAGVFTLKIPGELMPALDFCLEQGVDQVKFELKPQAPEDLPEFAPVYLEGLEKICEHYRNTGRPLHLYDLRHWVSSLIHSKRNYPCHHSPCGSGFSLQYLSRDLKIYPCRKMKDDRFLLGEAGSCPGIAELRVSSRVMQELGCRKISNLPRCRNCHYRNFCAGGCTYKAFSRYQQIMREDPGCAFFQKIFTGLLVKLAESQLPAFSLGVNID